MALRSVASRTINLFFFAVIDVAVSWSFAYFYLTFFHSIIIFVNNFFVICLSLLRMCYPAMLFVTFVFLSFMFIFGSCASKFLFCCDRTAHPLSLSLFTKIVKQKIRTKVWVKFMFGQVVVHCTIIFVRLFSLLLSFPLTHGPPSTKINHIQWTVRITANSNVRKSWKSTHTHRQKMGMIYRYTKTKKQCWNVRVESEDSSAQTKAGHKF